MTTPYTLPEPTPPNDAGETTSVTRWQVETQHGWVGAWDKKAITGLLEDAFAAGAASRDAEIAHLKQELQIECASNAIKDTDTAALRADALRYRWLRNHVIFGYPSSEGSSNKAAYLVVTGYGYRERKNLTDQAVDAASAAEGQAP